MNHEDVMQIIKERINGGRAHERIQVRNETLNNCRNLVRFDLFDCCLTDCQMEDCALIGCEVATCRDHGSALIKCNLFASNHNEGKLVECNIKDCELTGSGVFNSRMEGDSQLLFVEISNSFVTGGQLDECQGVSCNFIKCSLQGGLILDSSIFDCRSNDCEFIKCQTNNSQLAACQRTDYCSPN